MNESQVFTNALKLATAAERAAYLDEACAGNPTLRDAVDALLRAHAADPDFLEQPAPPLRGTVEMPAAFGPPGEQPPDPAAAEQPGVVLAGRYKLLQQVGEGGMGTVFMAEQTHPVQRKVALKLIKAGMDSRQVIARFEAERQALALMDHPNIARVLDAGTTEGGRPFFVMELVKGVPITRYCDEHHLTPRQRLELFVPVCQAVQHAHQKGIIHRDLKPSNVLVCLYDDKPVPKVIDFGIAKAAGARLTEKTLFTELGQVVGTLEYMSPEQAELNQLDIDTRSDIYSLGVLLYELLTGTTPLERKRFKVVAFLEVLRLIREEESPRPSTRLSTTEGLPAIAANRGLEPKKLSGLMRGELDWIVMKALEKDRSRRYDTANALAADVLRYLADEPVLACPPSARYRLRKFARRNKRALAVASVVALAAFVAVGSIAASIGWVVRDQEARQVESAQQVRESLNRARRWLRVDKLALARQELAEARGRIGNDRAALGTLADEVEALEAGLARFAAYFSLIDQARAAETAHATALAFPGETDHGRRPEAISSPRHERDPAKAVPLLFQALAHYAILEQPDWNAHLGHGPLDTDQVRQIRRTAYETLLWLADDVLTRQAGQRSGQRLSPEAAAQQALAYLVKAEAGHRPTSAFYRIRSRCRQALGQKEQAQADEQSARTTPPAIALDHYLTGQAAYDAGQKDEAIKQYQAALELEPTHYWSLLRLGDCLAHFARQDQDLVAAAAVYSGCIARRPQHAQAYYCRGIAFDRLRQDDKARQDHSRAIELAPAFASAWNNRGAANSHLRRWTDAIADFSKAIALEPDFAMAFTNRGVLHFEKGQRNTALADFSRAIELRPDFAVAWYSRGLLHSRMGNPEKALADYSRAVELEPGLSRAWNNRGVTYTALRRWDNALADFSKALEVDPNNAAALIGRGAIYCDQLRQYDKAVADFSEAIRLGSRYSDERYPDAWYNRGVAYAALRQPDKALADFTKALDLDPKHWKAWYHRGNAYLALQQPQKALADWSQTIHVNPGFAEAWTNRGCTYNDLGQHEKALAEFAEAIRLKPGLANAWYNRGNAHAALGQRDKALADYSQAIAVRPTYALAFVQRARLYEALKHWDRALADYQRCVDLAPKYAAAHDSFALLLATCPEPKFRDATRAVEVARKAVSLAPKQRFYWTTLGAAHYRAGSSKEALAALEKAMELSGGGNSFEWFLLAMTHWQLGQKDEARKWYERAAAWMEKHLPNDEQLRGRRADAAALLGIGDKKPHHKGTKETEKNP